MSQFYELMQSAEKDHALLSNFAAEPAFPIPGENRGRSMQPPSMQPQKIQPPKIHPPSIRELTVGLVKRIFLQPTPGPRMVVFASVDQGSGSTLIAGLVAQALAASDPGAVCLVEANFRSPALSRMLGFTNHHGLTDALAEQGGLRAQIKQVSNDGLWLLSSGPLAADSAALLSSERMRTLTAELRREFDFVIVDAPPIARYRDVIPLGKLSDGVVVVLDAEATRREAARGAVKSLRSSAISVIAAVLHTPAIPPPIS